MCANVSLPLIESIFDALIVIKQLRDKLLFYLEQNMCFEGHVYYKGNYFELT